MEEEVEESEGKCTDKQYVEIQVKTNDSIVSFV